MSSFKSFFSLSILMASLMIFSAGNVFAQEAERKEGNAEETRERNKKREESSKKELEKHNLEDRKNEMSGAEKQENDQQESQVERVSEDKPVSDRRAEERNSFGQKMANCRKIENKEARRQCRKERTSENRALKKSGAVEVAK